MLSISWHVNIESHVSFTEKIIVTGIVCTTFEEVFLSPYIFLYKFLYVDILSCLIFKSNKDALFTKLFALLKYVFIFIDNNL